MSLALQVDVNVVNDGATPEVKALIAATSPQRLAASVGPAIAQLTQSHFRSLGTNKRGWPSTKFWARAARATSWQDQGNGNCLVRVNQIGVRQRLRGGPIRPQRKKMLAIPISPVSYGKTPKDFPGLFPLRTKHGVYLVQYGDGTGTSKTKAARTAVAKSLGGNAGRRLRATLNFLFKLSAGVNQAPDPNVLPKKEDYGAIAKERILIAVRTRKGGGQTT